MQNVKIVLFIIYVLLLILFIGLVKNKNIVNEKYIIKTGFILLIVAIVNGFIFIYF